MLGLVIGMAPSAAMAGTSDLSAYLQARAADADGRVDVAVAAYAQALAADPADPVLAIRAYREGIEAGDIDEMGLGRPPLDFAA